MTNAFYIAHGTMPASVKTYLDAVNALPPRSGKTMYKRQMIVEFFKAGNTFGGAFWQFVQELCEEWTEAEEG